MTHKANSSSSRSHSAVVKARPNEYRRHGSRAKDIVQFLLTLFADFALLLYSASLLHRWPHQPLAAWLPLLLVSAIAYVSYFRPSQLRLSSYLRLCSLLLAVSAYQVALVCGLLWTLHLLGAFPSFWSAWRYAMLTPYLVAGIAFCRISPSLLRADPRRYVFNLMYDLPSIGVYYLYSQLLHWPLNSLFSEITPQLLLGSLPFAADVRTLSEAGVTAVVNMCDEYEGPVEQYRQYGIEQCRCPTVDMTPPTWNDLEKAVHFIQQKLAVTASSSHRSPRVFVHCKTGMSRSAAVVLCYLVITEGMTSKEAIRFMKKVRPDVSTTAKDYTPVVHYLRSLAGDGVHPVPDKQYESRLETWRKYIKEMFKL